MISFVAAFVSGFCPSELIAVSASQHLSVKQCQLDLDAFFIGFPPIDAHKFESPMQCSETLGPGIYVNTT